VSGPPESAGLGAQLAEIFAAWNHEIEERGLALRFEFDSDFVFERSEALDQALLELCRLILTTTPNGCEIYFGSARSTAPISRLGAGQWAARWQVVGDGAKPSGMTRIRPRRGSAAYQLTTGQADRVRGLFEHTPWRFSLEAVVGEEGLVARASLR
jgi:hypothetical protein